MSRSSLSLEVPEERRPRLGTDLGDNGPSKTLEEETPHERERPLRYKIFALLCVLSLALGSHYAAHALDSLKSTVKKELGISNLQYGIVQSSVSLVNTILPILGGVFIDTFGTSIGSILATSLIAIGNILVALSTNLKSFVVMVIGRTLYGLGSGPIVIVQVAILSHWFKGKGLAIVVGTQIAASRLSSFLTNITVVPIMEATGFYGWSLWFTALLCVISLIINISYVVIMRLLQEKLTIQEMMKIKQKRKFNPKKLLVFPTIFWIFALLEFELGSGLTSFLHISTELVKTRWGAGQITDKIAANSASVAQFLPIFLSPFLGYLLDRFGRRSLTLIISTVFLAISMFLLGFITLTPAVTMIGMICFSIALSLGPVGVLSSIPILLPLDYVGTALGIVKSSSNIGSTIYDILVGLLQDSDKGKYEKAMIFFLSSSILAIVVSTCLYIVSRNWHDGVMDMRDVERKEYSENHDMKIEERKKPAKSVYFFIGVYTCLLILSWVLFFVFLFK